MVVALLILVVAGCSPSIGEPSVQPKGHYFTKYFLNSRIVGGMDAPQGYGKHMVALLYGNRWVSFICGGSIISQRHILTAAHCIDVMLTWEQELVRSFRGVIGTNTWVTGTKEVDFSGYVIHSGWDWNTIKYDIGLLTVVEEIQLSDNVAIIPLSFDFVADGVETYVTGWGLHEDMHDLPETLQKLQVWTLDHQDCKERMDKVSKEVGPMPDIQKDVEICALHSYGHGMCNGDSGSALILRDAFVQIGIVSWGVPCGTGAPDVYARISGFKYWLLYHTQGYLT